LFSGGNDSVCAVHLASQAKQFDGAVYIDTGIKIQAALDHAKYVAKIFDWPFRVIETPESYGDIVRKHGFPGAAAHRYMYIMLKERAIDRLLRETKTARSQRIMLITGVRRYESQRRMENVVLPVVKIKSKVWVAPMWNWTDEIKENYAQSHDLPRNPIKPVMHISGDCLCGAYNSKGDLALLEMFFPDDAKKVIELQKEVIKSHPWNWDEMPPKWWKKYQDGQMFLGNQFMPLCWNCEHMAEESLSERQNRI
jgi:3'-phosphoadenosine 5'-phosphosulfate sulfotransferase (PAPS reductase)/FAD synthetase